MHDFTKPGMSEATAREIKRLTSPGSFGERVSRANRKALKLSEFGDLTKRHPCRSTTAKALSYYDGDASKARFILKPPEQAQWTGGRLRDANAAALVLQRLGASVEFTTA